MSNLQKRLQTKGVSNKLPSMPPRAVPAGSRSSSLTNPRKRDYSQLPWRDYFDSSQDVKVEPDSCFHVYRRGSEGPVVLFLHGGGLSALSWALLSSKLTDRVKCQCVAMDFRGHGNTVSANETDLSVQTLASDVHNVISTLFAEFVPPIIIVGHSMGGAIAVHVAASGFLPTVVGLLVIDVVEGTALEALLSMQSFLRGRPQQFRSLEYAIEWAVKSGQIRNVESARVSMIGQLQRCSSEPQLSSNELPRCSVNDTLEEEDESSSDKETSNQCDSHLSQEPSTEQYTWRVDLSKSEMYWKEWFVGLSKLFLSCPVPKMLMLAGVDRLDTELATGQMQGKFWLQVMARCGHCMHEDQPQKVADVLAAFMIRNKFAEAVNEFQWPSVSC